MPPPEATALALAALVGGALAAAASWGLTGLLRRVLLRLEVLDRPNHRSSHRAPVPRGGGLAVVASVVALAAAPALWPGLGAPLLPWPWLALALALALLSFRDDRTPLPVSVRLLAHVAAVAAALPALADIGSVTQGLLPVWADLALAGLAWVAFLNFFNFMDGIDGMAAVETTAIGLGAALIGLAAGGVMAGAALGFLVWNRHPARIFLGDAGSVPLGFLLGGVLLALAANGQWAAALILPAYYLGDAGLTMARRLLRGERIWEAHRSHFYQRAAQALASHAPVVRAVALANLALIALALVSMAGAPAGASAPVWIAGALAGAVAVVGGLLAWMARA